MKKLSIIVRSEKLDDVKPFWTNADPPVLLYQILWDMVIRRVIKQHTVEVNMWST